MKIVPCELQKDSLLTVFEILCIVKHVYFFFGAFWHECMGCYDFHIEWLPFQFHQMNPVETLASMGGTSNCYNTFPHLYLILIWLLLFFHFLSNLISSLVPVLHFPIFCIGTVSWHSMSWLWFYPCCKHFLQW